MTKRKNEQSEPSWKELVRELAKLQKEKKETSEQLRLIESKYLQVIASMRPWDNCQDGDLYEVWTELARFYFRNGRSQLALEMADQLEEIILIHRWDEEYWVFGVELFNLFLYLGLPERSIELAKKLQGNRNLQIQALISKRGDEKTINAADESESSLSEYFEMLGEEANSFWEGLTQKAKDSISRRNKSRQAFAAASIVYVDAVDRLKKASGGAPVNLFVTEKLKNLERGIVEEMSPLKAPNQEDIDGMIGD